MQYDGLTVDHGGLMEARRGSPRRPHAVPRWAPRLAAEPWLANHEVGDLLYDVTSMPGSHWGGELVTQVTGVPPQTLFHHPGRSTSALGTPYYPSPAVALALVRLARLGVPVDAKALTEPLRRRLARKRENPLLTRAALYVLWAPGADRRPARCVWAGAHDAPREPYALTLADGRTVVGFADPHGRRVEVIGRRGLYAEALRGGVRLSRTAFQRLLRSPGPASRCVHHSLKEASHE